MNEEKEKADANVLDKKAVCREQFANGFFVWALYWQIQGEPVVDAH